MKPRSQATTAPGEPGEPGDIEPAAPGHQSYIANRRSRAWAELFNLRYRLLLGYLAHILHLRTPRYVKTGPDKGDRTPRGLLLRWAFDEMRHLQKISWMLVRLPLGDGGRNAGPPFQLPYMLALPHGEHNPWRRHLDVVRASLALLDTVLCAPGSVDRTDPFLEDRKTEDRDNERVMEALAAGGPIPPGAQPTAFQKVATMLEEGVRGFDIRVHGHFWAGITRDEFVALHLYGLEDPDDRCELTVAKSFLLTMLGTGHMPLYRPLIDASRIEFLCEWIEAQAPDNDPPGQMGVRKERDPKLDPK